MFGFFASHDSQEFHKWATACIALLAQHQVLILKHLLGPREDFVEIRKALGLTERLFEAAQKQYLVSICDHKFEKNDKGKLYCSKGCGWEEPPDEPETKEDPNVHTE